MWVLGDYYSQNWSSEDRSNKASRNGIDCSDTAENPPGSFSVGEAEKIQEYPTALKSGLRAEVWGLFIIRSDIKLTISNFKKI